MVPPSPAKPTTRPKSSPTGKAVIAPAGWRSTGPLPTPGTGEVPAQCVVVAAAGGLAAGGASGARRGGQAGFVREQSFDTPLRGGSAGHGAQSSRRSPSGLREVGAPWSAAVVRGRTTRALHTLNSITPRQPTRRLTDRSVGRTAPTQDTTTLTGPAHLELSQKHGRLYLPCCLYQVGTSYPQPF